MKREYSAGIVAYDIQVIDKVSTRLYLLLLYPGGYWDFAKGHLEPNESNLEAAHRELKEETGLESNLQDGFKEILEYMFKNKQGELIAKKVTFFLGKATSNTVQLSLEHEDFAWLPHSEALNQLTYNNAKQLLQVAESYFIEK